ncbi:hypothetical protein HK099_007761 [Clydaea vesicula]|uniref:PPM-type phosphatase domain-containing protein n=1 Tax=Clydaea vesicula TaxID=447962 RepID=A0AAD5XW76_9FUNG|nr:hypothetical protein HK099_007761 [Clydaea vesicula]
MFQKQTDSPASITTAVYSHVEMIHKELTLKYNDEKTTPLEIQLILNRLENIFFRFQMELYFVESLILLYKKFLEKMFQKKSKITSQHFKNFPTVFIKNSTFNAEPVSVRRHPVDSRWDFLALKVNGRTVPFGDKGHPLTDFCALEETSINNLECMLTATYGWITKKPTTTLPSTPNFAKLKKPGFSSSTLSSNKSLSNGSNATVSDTASASESSSINNSSNNSRSGSIANFKMESTNPYIKDGKVLINDPNNDGYLVYVFKGLTVGCVIDGSGSGLRAKLAGNLVLATVNDLLPELKQLFLDNSSKKISSMELHKWLQKVIIESHIKIKSISEAGSTTLIAYVLTELEEPIDDDKLLLCYLASGDVEAFHCSHKRNLWSNLLKEPCQFTKLRFDTSITPGGVGGYHGDEESIYGLYFWKNEDWGKNMDSKPKSSKTNNLHFGQILINPSDKLIFATDGLGDAIDPIRIFLRPSCALKSLSYLNDQIFFDRFEKKLLSPKVDKAVLKDWLVFGKAITFSAMEVNDLKNLIFNKFINDDSTKKTNVVEEGAESSGNIENLMDRMVINNTEVQKEKNGNEEILSASEILNKCVDFAFYTTEGSRKIGEDSFGTATEENWTCAIKKYWDRRNKMKINENTDWKSFVANFAKPDHLGIVCFNANIIE